MISVNFLSLQELQQVIAGQVRAKRLELNLSQQSLAKKSGVSYGSLKKFERTGEISLKSLLKLALVLECMDNFKALFALKSPEAVLSLDELLEDKNRQRGRK